MRFGCVLWFVALALIVGGVQGLYVGLANRTVQAMAYREFLQKKPSSGWIEITDARLNLLGAIGQSNRFTGTVKQLYIPVGSSAEGEGGGDDEKIQLLLLTRDNDILATVKDFQEATGGGGGLAGKIKRRVQAERDRQKGGVASTPKKDDEAEALRFVLQNRDRFLIDRPVRGLLQFGLDSRARDRDRIQRLDPDIAPDFAVMEDGSEPQVGLSAFLLVCGLGLGALLLRSAGRWRSAGDEETAASGDPAPGPGPGTPPTA
jgi:hypothetical protein